MGDPISSKNSLEDRPVQRSEVSMRIQKAPKADDVISTITEDSFISFRKKFHFSNNLVMKVPARSDPGLRFSPSSELIDILTICWVCLSQFSYRVMSIVMGMIVLFRDRGVVLSSECLSRMGHLFSDEQGLPNDWISVLETHRKNDWNLQEKWEKLKELPVSLHIEAEDLLRILKLPDLDALHYEVRYLSRYIDEEYLFKVGFLLKQGEVVPQKSHSKRLGNEEGLQAPRKKKADEIFTVVSKGPRVSSSKSYIPEDVLNHQCIGRRRAEELGEYKKKYDSKVKEMKVMEDQLAGVGGGTGDDQAAGKESLPSTIIKEFKKSYAFKIIIEDHIQEARNHIYDVEVKALEAECTEDGFIRGFMKGVRAVHHKTGAEIEGLTPNQASGDASSDSGGEELESELQQAFSLEEDEDDIDIL
ncbi:hypothetical protein IEQ34_012151 [Dendrobium chrysotoxum]|uniref:Uncharacterized protein n=1 Tax=Dendrobium chrysotoxum TaxID=161865 RepID=A0AAV7GT59_DENCH|nr:hypothetical protein IEQ34_012151 [Dendrobium chrysotoxum]